MVTLQNVSYLLEMRLLEEKYKKDWDEKFGFGRFCGINEARFRCVQLGSWDPWNKEVKPPYLRTVEVREWPPDTFCSTFWHSVRLDRCWRDLYTFPPLLSSCWPGKSSVESGKSQNESMPLLFTSEKNLILKLFTERAKFMDVQKKGMKVEMFWFCAPFLSNFFPVFFFF